MIDLYTKAVLTAIALGLLGLNVNLFWPRASQADLPPGTVTVGQFKAAEDKSRAVDDLPLVMVLDVMRGLEVKIKDPAAQPQ
jgi:hypothetical protein